MSTPETQEVRASANWVRITPRKARLVVEHIRGRTVPEARTMLAFSERAAAREIDKLLRSAVANAEANHDLIGDDLVVKTVYVDEDGVHDEVIAAPMERRVGLGVRDCRAQHLLDVDRGGALGEREDRPCLGHAPPADVVRNEARLAR